MKNVLICIGGASANYLALELARVLCDDFIVHLVLSKGAKNVLRYEMNALGVKKYIKKTFGKKAYNNLQIHKNSNLAASISSGSVLNNTSFVGAFYYASCDMLSDLALGKADSLISRSFVVCQKQRVPITIAAREAPYTSTLLKYMLKLSKQGCAICPPMMASYSDDDMAKFVLGKWCDSLGIASKYARWQSKAKSAKVSDKKAKKHKKSRKGI